MLADKWHLLTCVNSDGECVVNAAAVQLPNACRSCRFDKCLYEGMRVESVLRPGNAETEAEISHENSANEHLNGIA